MWYLRADTYQTALMGHDCPCTIITSFASKPACMLEVVEGPAITSNLRRRHERKGCVRQSVPSWHVLARRCPIQDSLNLSKLRRIVKARKTSTVQREHIVIRTTALKEPFVSIRCLGEKLFHSTSYQATHHLRIKEKDHAIPPRLPGEQMISSLSALIITQPPENWSTHSSYVNVSGDLELM